MGDRILYEQFLKGTKGESPAGKPDPRLIALVRFLARRAAERDYAERLAEEDPSPK